jgi:CubicO group peptidase (beta-lactamase class C family)
MPTLLILLGVAAHFAVADRSGPGTAIVVTRGDTVVRLAATGQDGNGAPITADTPMRVASLSKSFTAAAVLALVDAGKVDLDRPIASYLPEFRMADPRASAITVRQLLNQTSGLSDRTIDIDATQRAADLTAYVAALANSRLAAAPGTHWEYCNVNYDVAARLVEVADGRPFAKAMQQLVFGPLAMTHSSVAAPDGANGARPADGFISVFGVWVARPELPGFRGGAGGVVTTAADMGRWLISQTGHGPQILSAASRRVMQTPGAAAGDYAMGWGVEHVAGRTLLVHSGNLFTYNAVQAIDPATGEGWAVLANSASLVDPTYDELLALIGGSAPPSGERQLIEGALGAIALVAVGLGLAGMRHARRPRRGWRLVPPLIPLAVFATYPQWTSLLMHGRRVTWAQMTYFPAPLTITLGLAALAGLVTVIARLRWMGSSR